MDVIPYDQFENRPAKVEKFDFLYTTTIVQLGSTMAEVNSPRTQRNRN
jgi:hypothetical protein